MAESVLMGAGIGAGVNMLRGNDPLQGAVMGGAAGGIFGTGGLGAGAGGTVTSQGPAHLGAAAFNNTGVVAPHLVSQPSNTGLLSSLGGAGDVFKSGQGLLQDTFGISPEQQNMEMLKFGIDKMTPEQQQQIQHANLAQVAGNPNAVGGGVNSVGPTEQQVSMGGSPYPDFRRIKIGG